MKKIDPEFWNGRRVFITGVNGFVGSYLSEKLVTLGAKVSGLVRRHAVPHFPNIRDHLEKGDIKLYGGNLIDLTSIVNAIRDFEADVIFHLGAQSFVPSSVTAPMEVYSYNIMGTANVLESIRLTESVEHMQFAGSSEEYGLVLEQEIPIKETNPLRPLSPYALSKVAGDLMCFTHYKNYGIPVVRTRAFNHTGPRRGSQFVLSHITRSVAHAITKETDTITLGNLEPIRDFTDVRDIIRGYMLAIERGDLGDVYNFGTGKGYTIKEVAELAIELGNVGDRVSIEQDKHRYRKSDVMVLICDARKARDRLGWKPEIDLRKTIQDMIRYYSR
ncbi:NAD-dependent epimerase/dehydratase family protein [Candidatus Bathyarchaeota archaeon]|nr:NAD-dependent epimerase/dehydratase family protein [Candidatus Bathyarchaeota archaeon]